MDAVLARSVTCRRRLGHDRMQLAGQRLVTKHQVIISWHVLVHTGASASRFHCVTGIQAGTKQ